MIVYRNERRRQHVPILLRQLNCDAHVCASSFPLAHDRARDLLIHFGILEAGVIDAISSDVDDTSATTRTLREMSRAVGRLFVASHIGAPDSEQRELAARVVYLLRTVASMELPENIQVGVPEGYAYYALYPEQYVSAAADLARSIRPESVVCIGVRGIGTSLSVAVSAMLERYGCVVHTHTVRPRGHPLDRHVAISRGLERELSAQRDALFVVVDEGPGLSGSSFASVAVALSALGIPDRNIVFMPSWPTDGSGLISDAARTRWPRHRQFTSTFEHQFIDGCQLADAFMPGALITDLSAGKWRELVSRQVSSARSVLPVVQSQHERRKYLLQSRGRPGLLVKFTGLGDSGRAAHERARRIADAGFGLKHTDIRDGFAATEMLDAVSCDAGHINESVLDRLTDYLTFVGREFPVGDTQRAVVLRDMIEINTREALGESATARVNRFLRDCMPTDEHPVALDARMFPHEWLQVGDTLLKTDAVDHHDDHFFPGRQDIAWDLAATAVEFKLDTRAERYMLHRYSCRTGDQHVGRRMPFYRVAYLAYRVGYAVLAAQTLQGTDDGCGWLGLASAYRHQLRGALGVRSNAA